MHPPRVSGQHHTPSTERQSQRPLHPGSVQRDLSDRIQFRERRHFHWLEESRMIFLARKRVSGALKDSQDLLWKGSQTGHLGEEGPQ